MWVLAQPWEGPSLALVNSNYSADGAFRRESDFFGVQVSSGDTFQVKGNGLGLDLGYQFVLSKHASLYLFADGFSGGDDIITRDQEGTENRLDNLSYRVRAFGTEGRYWSRGFYGAIGVARIQDEHRLKDGTDEILSFLPKSMDGKLTAFPSLGYENYVYGITVRFSVRSVKNLVTAERISSTKYNLLAIGYRWGS